MAERLGANLLAEIKEESFDELLRGLRPLLHQPSPALGYQPIDSLLEIFCSLKSSPQRFHGDNHEYEGTGPGGLAEDDSNMFRLQRERHAPWKPAVVELSSTREVWTRSILYHLTAVSVLPVHFGGQNLTVVWLNTNACFSATSLKEEMDEVCQKSSEPKGHDRDQVALDSLNHVHVFRVRSSEQLIGTLENLSKYLLGTSGHLSADRRVGLVILSSATAFYWQDRVAAEEAYYMHTDRPDKQPSRTANVIKQLEKVQKEFDCAVVYSTSVQSQPQPYGRRAQGRQSKTAVPEEPPGVSSWTAFATLTLRVSGLQETQNGATLAGGQLDADGEQKQPWKQSLIGEPDFNLSDRWTASTKKSLQELEGHGRFGFR